MMKKLFVTSLIIFWGVTVSLLTAGLVSYEAKNNLANDNDLKLSLGGNSEIIGGVKGTSNTTGKQQYMNASIVAQHKVSTDCWLIINNKVYDVSEYIPYHPGGQNSIIDNCGNESTKLFTSDSGSGHNHSSSASALLGNYFVANMGDAWGTVVGGNNSANGATNTNTQTPTPTPINTKPPTNNQNTTTTQNNSSQLTAFIVANHNSSNDCWLIVSDKVYDVTQYIPFHPGGTNSIINNCGTDSTTLFTSNVNGGHSHSNSANSLLANYYVGDMQSSYVTPIPTAQPSNRWSGDDDDDDDD